MRQLFVFSSEPWSIPGRTPISWPTNEVRFIFGACWQSFARRGIQKSVVVPAVRSQLCASQLIHLHYLLALLPMRCVGSLLHVWMQGTVWMHEAFHFPCAVEDVLHYGYLSRAHHVQLLGFRREVTHKMLSVHNNIQQWFQQKTTVWALIIICTRKHNHQYIYNSN
jgi:hypothetical protein